MFLALSRCDHLPRNRAPRILLEALLRVLDGLRCPATCDHVSVQAVDGALAVPHAVHDLFLPDPQAKLVAAALAASERFDAELRSARAQDAGPLNKSIKAAQAKQAAAQAQLAAEAKVASKKWKQKIKQVEKLKKQMGLRWGFIRPPRR